MDFKQFMDTLTTTNSTLELLVGFDKVKNNLATIEMKLTQLNYLLNKQDLKLAVNNLFSQNKDCFSVLNILCAVRDNKATIDKESRKITFINDYFENSDSIYEFLTKTGLADIFSNGNLTNLVDYVFGIEVGLDTNARKNRGGTVMEEMISEVFTDAKIEFKTQVQDKDIVGFPDQSFDKKQYDFVIITKRKTYLIETNFYNGGGSKLNEVARSYTDLAKNINKHDAFEFVWITDGLGWRTAKNKLKEAFEHIPCIYNLSTINQFIENISQEL